MPLPTTSTFVRSTRVLGLPVAAVRDAGTGAVRRVLGADAEDVRRDNRRRNAERTRRVLGELKGGALKAGQLVSTVEALFPADPDERWREALTSLQESVPGLPLADVEPILHAELGPRWRSRFSTFDETPVAAASLGQVHRATDSRGRRLAVKVQYPGMREAVTADVRALSLALRATSLVARGVAMPPLVAELRTRLAEELDYVHEAKVQTAFAEAYDGDADVEVPTVVSATRRVLIQTWLGGMPLAQVATHGRRDDRDRLALLYQRFLLAGPRRAGWLHTDPHPGNFRLTEAGRLGVLDFGSALAMPSGLPRTFGRLISVLLDGDLRTVERGLREEGFVRPDRHVDVQKLVDYLAPFSEPARHESFHYTRAWLASQFARVNDPRNPDFVVALQLNLPAEHLFTHRVWLGCVGVLCQLDATVPVRSELREWLPGFEAGP